MHDSMQYDSIQGQDHDPFKVGNSAVSTAISSAIYIGNWQLITDALTTAQYKFVWARFMIFGLVFVSRDFEVGTNVSSEESTVSPEAVLAIRPGRPRLTQTRAWPTQTKFCPTYTTPVGYPKFAWPFDWPTQMKIPRTAPPSVPVVRGEFFGFWHP